PVTGRRSDCVDRAASLPYPRAMTRIVGIESFRTAAATLGLRLEAPEMSWWKNYDLAMLEGTVDGVRVLVQQGFTKNIGDRPALRVYFHALLDPPWDLGLKISLKPHLGRATPLGERDVAGSAAFDAAFTIKGAEPSRVQAFLTPELRAALALWHNARRWE